jgi:hypothetical protein
MQAGHDRVKTRLWLTRFDAKQPLRGLVTAYLRMAQLRLKTTFSFLRGLKS